MKTLISVLGGDLWNDAGIWRCVDGDFRISSDTGHSNFRVPAAVCFAREVNGTLLVQGGLADTKRPSLARVMHTELTQLGVDESSVIEEDISTSTFGQLLELQRIARDTNSPGVSIISNEWHLPRIAAMLKHSAQLSFLASLQPTLVAAEDVLLSGSSSNWEEKISEARNSQATLERIELEKQGISQIENGTYHFG